MWPGLDPGCTTGRRFREPGVFQNKPLLPLKKQVVDVPSIPAQGTDGAGKHVEGTGGVRGNCRLETSPRHTDGSLGPVTCSQQGLPGRSLPGEMKKVLHSFLSRVTSRISLVMLIILPATGGTRRKSRILAGGAWEGVLSAPLWLPQVAPRECVCLCLWALGFHLVRRGLCIVTSLGNVTLWAQGTHAHWGSRVPWGGGQSSGPWG